jgi:hypothetical protein
MIDQYIVLHPNDFERLLGQHQLQYPNEIYNVKMGLLGLWMERSGAFYPASVLYEHSTLAICRERVIEMMQAQFIRPRLLIGQVPSVPVNPPVYTRGQKKIDKIKRQQKKMDEIKEKDRIITLRCIDLCQGQQLGKPSINAIATARGLSFSTTRSHINALKRLGYLKRHLVITDTGRELLKRSELPPMPDQSALAFSVEAKSLTARERAPIPATQPQGSAIQVVGKDEEPSKKRLK